MKTARLVSKEQAFLHQVQSNLLLQKQKVDNIKSSNYRNFLQFFEQML